MENVEGKQYNFDFILPVKSYNNNSNSSNNKTLSWYIEGNRNNTIQFSFIIFNPAVMIVFLTLVSIGIVALVLIYKKRKLNQLIDMTSLRESISIDDYQEEKKKIDPYSAGGATVYNPAIFNYGKLSTTISPYDNQKTIDDLIEEYDEDYGEKEVIPLNDIKEPDFKMINEGKMVSLDEMKDVFKRKIDVEEIANNDEYDPLNELYNRKEIQKSIEKKLSAKIEEPKQEKATPTTTTFLGAQQKTEMGDTPKSTTFVLPKDSEKETIPEEKKINNEPRRNMFVTQDSPQNASVSTNNIPVKKPMFIDIPDAEEIIKTNTSSNQNGVIENNVSKQNETITEDKPKPNKFIN